MKIDFTALTGALSVAVDCAEKAILDVAPYHGMRVAVLANRMAVRLGIGEEIIYPLTMAAMLHDCALSEYLSDEFFMGETVTEADMSAHCIAGEKMLRRLPFYNSVRGAVLYHHERADGKGALKKTADGTPVYARIIHAADAADVLFSLHDHDPGKYRKIMEWIVQSTGTLIDLECAEALSLTVTPGLLYSISGENVKSMYLSLLPARETDIPVSSLKEIASVFADITDYKSHFTWRHSMGIAEKAEAMGKFFSLSEDECGKLFVAGALHDIGKLLISSDILEKPGRLSDEEYMEIQNHAMGTWDMLKDVSGLEDICRWASLHHEKLDGSGYPFGYTGADLDRNSRLMACLDIYQALIEERPYKAGMSHGEAMGILHKMGSAGQLDPDIINSIDLCFRSAEDTAVVPEKVPSVMDGGSVSYRCPVCGYVIYGEVPEGFICPRCEQPGSIFEKA